MKIGSLVELVDDRWDKDNYAVFYPIKNTIYTVRDIGKHLTYSDNVPLILEEIVNPIRIYGSHGKFEPCWKANRFRELLPPIANIEEHINQNTLEPQLK